LSGIGKGFPLRWGLGLIRTEGMPYSNDLRLRVLAAVDGGVPVRQVAALLRVSVSYIYKALCRADARPASSRAMSRRC